MAKLGKAEEDDYITGDRMATFMLYLSEVLGCSKEFGQRLPSNIGLLLRKL